METMHERLVKFGNPELAGVLHASDRKNSPCIITCHGLRSSKDSDKYVGIGRRLCSKGFTVLRFDFRGCGESDGRFEETTLTARIEDLEAALGFVRMQGHKTVGMMGSSLGGTVAVLTAARDGQIKAIATWSTPYHLNDLPKEEEAHLKGLKYDAGKYDVGETLKEVNCPILIIHGNQDKQVSLSHARLLYRDATEPKKIEIISGADHRFTNLIHRRKAVELTENWLKRYLAKDFGRMNA